MRSREEIIVEYDTQQRELYKQNDKRCIYPIWPHKVGIHKAGGNFPAMVARKHFEDLGYKVLPSYYLVRNPNIRKDNAGFKFLCKMFGNENTTKVIEHAKEIGLKGGDPDLFVYNDKDKFSECFFVEAKEKDELSSNQKKLIPIIEKYLCKVLIVRVKRQM
jgi:hypothetical protein